MTETPSPEDEEVTRRYFELSLAIEQAKSHGDYKAAIVAARETFRLLRGFVGATIREHGRWIIDRSHAIHTASPLMAVEEDGAAIADLRATLQGISELSEDLPVADQAEEDLATVVRIKAAVRKQPGIHQMDLKEATGLSDGRRIGTLIGYLERGGHIRRIRTGGTYELYSGGFPISSARSDRLGSAGPSSGPSESSHLQLAITFPILWKGRSALEAREIDLKRVRMVRLPMAPTVWEQADRVVKGTPATRKDRGGPAFTVAGAGWTLADEKKLPPEERPDPAFKESYVGRRWTYWIDPRGHTTRWPTAPSILQVTDAAGAVTAERGLGWDTYRVDSNTDGSGVLFLSRDGVLHGYGSDLQPFLVVGLRDLPEYQACANRLGIPDDHLRNHVRCVAISDDRTRYVVTVVDEAWCLSMTGEVLWGLRFPTSDRWTPVTRSVDVRGPSGEVIQALTLLGLALPVSPEDITRAYRQLAMAWHPDRNLGDPSALRRMQELNAAMALLAGMDTSALTVPQIEHVTRYEDVTSRQTLGDPTSGISFTMSLVAGPLQAADWIYAANVGEAGRVYLAGYSGRVLEVTKEGVPTRAYDIGAVPRDIAETAEYLYILTDTRLYVLKGEQLIALLDVFEQGRLIITDSGLGLFQSKDFTWLSPSGQVIGTVRSRDPIRRVLSTTAGLVVESRQRRALVHGAPPWW